VTPIVNKKFLLGLLFASFDAGGLIEMLIVFIATTLGCAFGFRIRALACESRLASQSTLTKIGTVAALIGFASVILLARSRFGAWFASFAPALWMLAQFLFERARRETRFRSELYGFLNAVILRMKSGDAFRAALDGAIEDADVRARPRLLELRDVVVFSQQTPSAAVERVRARGGALALAARELAHADRDAHAAIRRCAALRDRVRLEDEFRRKSGQASRQARAQSLVLAGLYLATFVFVAREFGIAAHARGFALSAAMFTVGLIWTQAAGRKMKWTT
jgi:Flp pilus assembly protein TadB